MAEATQTADKQLLLQKIYIKDVSFECPRSPDVFSSEVSPQTRLNIKTGANQMADDHQEVVLTLTVEAVDGDQTLFLVEIEQAGIFRLKGYSREEIDMLLGSYCPGTLYPFAREAIADLVSRGGFPQLLLQPINFDALYAQAVQERSQQDGGETADTPPSTH